MTTLPPLSSHDDGLTSGSYSYNALNQKLSETVTYPNFSKSFSYDYTANGLKKSFTMLGGTAYDYTYGENNELREIRLPSTGSISYPSYTWTRPDAGQYPGGGRWEYSYDPLMRLTRILAKDPGKNIVLDYSYSYDSMDNILSKQTGQEMYNYTYDALYRLTDVQVDIPGLENEGFGYDAVGNRLTEEGVEGEWAYNDNNELLTFATTEYTHDANGNATQLLLDGTVMFTYHYNAQDRLVQVDDVNGDTLAEYSYDPFGRRLWKDVGGTRIYFFYADEGLVAEYDENGLEIRSYGYRPNSTWTTDPLWLKQDSEYYFYQNDHLGTPQKLVKQNGAIAWSASYTAFGKATVDVETVTNNLRFPGQYFDAETGWHYNGQRYYHPNIGKYSRIDPIGFWGGTVNLYGYSLNNPITLFDHSGLYLERIMDRYFRSPVDNLYWKMKRRFPPKSQPRRNPNSFYVAAEGQWFIGGAGYTLVGCCDINQKPHVFKYFKDCHEVPFAPALGGGVTVYGIIRGMDGVNCNPRRYEGLFIEVALGPFGVDIGLTEEGKYSGVFEAGISLGLGFKGTMCKYQYIGPVQTARFCCR